MDLPAWARIGDITVEGRALDVSQSGMRLGTELPAEGTLVDVELCLPDADTPLYLTGEVRWSGARDGLTGAGISFAAPPPHDRLRLANFVLRRAAHGTAR